MTSNVIELRKNRKSAVVLKTELAILRNREPDCTAIVFEGKPDAIVFEVWINRINSEFEWTTLIAEGKGNLLNFRAMLGRDVTGLADGTYSIIDCDYDELRAFQPGDDIYVLPAHSIENILTAPESIDRLIRSSLTFPGGRDSRALAIKAFRDRREEFMELLLPLCGAMLAASRAGNTNIQVDESIGKHISIHLQSVTIKNGSELSMIAHFSQLPPEDLTFHCINELRARGLELWIRGKFLHYFFRKFCDLLEADMRSSQPSLFPAQHLGSFNKSHLDPPHLAALSALPIGLSDAVARWAN